MKRSSIVMAGLALAFVGAAAFFLLQRGPSLPADPLAIVPADAYGFARIKPSRVVKSQAWQRLVVARDEARGIERVEAECGFNPFAELEELVVFARPSPKGGMPRFAFAARGPLKHEAIIDCLRKITGKGGGALHTEDIDGITTVRSDKGTSRAAFVGRDGIIGGDTDSVRSLINTLKGKAQSAAADPMFRELYADVQQGTDVALVARMPDEFVPMLRMLSRLGGEGLSVVSELRAVGVSATAVEDRIAGGAVFVSPDASRAQSLVELVAMVRARLLDIPGIGLTPANALLNSIKMEARNDRATFTGSIKLSAAEMLIELAPALAEFGGSNGGGAQSAAAAAARLLGGAQEDDAKEPEPGAQEAQPAPQKPAPVAQANVAPVAADKPAPQKPAKPGKNSVPAPLAPTPIPAPGTPTIQPLGR